MKRVDEGKKHCPKFSCYLGKFNKWGLILAALTKQYSKSFLCSHSNKMWCLLFMPRPLQFKSSFNSRQICKLSRNPLSSNAILFQSWIMHENYTFCFQIQLNLYWIANIFDIVLHLSKLTYMCFNNWFDKRTNLTKNEVAKDIWKYLAERPFHINSNYLEVISLPLTFLYYCCIPNQIYNRSAKSPSQYIDFQFTHAETFV